MSVGVEVSTNLAQRLKIGKSLGQGAYATVHRAVLDGHPVALKRPLTRERCTRQTLLRASMDPAGGSYSRRSMDHAGAASAPSFTSISQAAGRTSWATGGGASAAPASALFLALPGGSSAPYAVDVSNKNMHEPLALSPAVLLVQTTALRDSATGTL
ncbi:hypothetical protein TSOC_008604 [Tetrabaena socialis]|uniref:Protein kinase domain-containing protein n=1 Tax=Tetrabaena socialis TaxID=47790 RepID=A0A2J7ZY22_9CHLO|nr:hypothetical protein TSOC_008604 [Tetrabaena socialis]|eukprot:PNH05166.1 hypothetical protein TSOC_008604 [Tetrabaena socialis]